MKNLFKVRKANRVQREQYKLNLEIPKCNQVSFGTKSLHMQGPRVWNALPFHIKYKEHLQAFKYVIKFWDGSKCSCNICFNSNISVWVTLVFGRNSVIFSTNSSLLNNGKLHFFCRQ